MTINLPARLSAILLAIGVSAGLAMPAAAQSKQDRQITADLRMIQEQSQQLQALLDQLSATLKALNARLDEQANANRKAFADQKQTIDTLSSDLRVVREKVDDNNVRIGSLTQELESLRQSVRQLQTAPAPTAAAAGVPGETPAAGSQTAPTPTSAPIALGTSPQRAWDTAYSDYVGGQYDLAVLGFDAYIRDFPKSDQADNAQLLIGQSLALDNKHDKAIEAFDKAIRAYPAGDAIPDAYYQKAVALKHLGQIDQVRAALQFLIKTFPDSDAGRLGKQMLNDLPKPD